MNRFGRNLGLKKNGSKKFSPRKDAQREQITPFLMCCFCFTLLFPLEKLNVLEVPQHNGFFGVKNHHFCEFPKGLSLNPNQKPLKNNTCTILFCFRQLWVFFSASSSFRASKSPSFHWGHPVNPVHLGVLEGPKRWFFWGGGSCPSRKKGHEARKTLLIHPIWVVKLEQTFFFKREHPQTLGEGSDPMSTEPHIFSDGLVEKPPIFQ